MTAMHHACKNLSNESRNNMYYFNKDVVLFSNSTKGIYHAGGLLSQHILVIGAAKQKLEVEFSNVLAYFKKTVIHQRRARIF
eukprot:9356912-Ditylum_brightwellii.AAC.1